MNAINELLKSENEALRTLQKTTENAFQKAMKEKDVIYDRMIAYKLPFDKRNDELFDCALECKNRKTNMERASVSIGAAAIMLDTYIHYDGDPEMVRILDTLNEALRFL